MGSMVGAVKWLDSGQTHVDLEPLGWVRTKDYNAKSKTKSYTLWILDPSVPDNGYGRLSIAWFWSQEAKKLQTNK